jgi:orotate phosphoribosyltransferase
VSTLDEELRTATDPTGVFLPSAQRRDELLADLLATARVPGTGEIDAGALQSRTSVLRRLAAALAEALPPATERLLTGHGAGTALTTAIALHTGLPFAALDEDAASAPRQVGEMHRNEHVGIVVPVVRTGGRALALVRWAVTHGARPAGVFAAVDQDLGAAAALAGTGHALHALYTVPPHRTRS